MLQGPAYPFVQLVPQQRVGNQDTRVQHQPPTGRITQYQPLCAPLGHPRGRQTVGAHPVVGREPSRLEYAALRAHPRRRDDDQEQHGEQRPTSQPHQLQVEQHQHPEVQHRTACRASQLPCPVTIVDHSADSRGVSAAHPEARLLPHRHVRATVGTAPTCASRRDEPVSRCRVGLTVLLDGEFGIDVDRQVAEANEAPGRRGTNRTGSRSP